MRSLWSDEDARRAVDQWGSVAGPELALRVYTSRLIGSEPDLVLHGGGNTSVKGRTRTLLGDEVDCLWVKGSGSSLDVVVPRDFPALDLAYLRRLRSLPSLSDEEMVNQLRTHLFDAQSPNPSVEALLHAFMELQRKIDSQKLTGVGKAEHLERTQPSEFPVPAFGAHDLQPPANPALFHPPKIERS